MADTLPATGLTPQQWDDEYFMEYVRDSRFKRYIGTSENSIIQVKEDLTRKRGDKVTYAAVRKLANAGFTGHTRMKGNEPRLDSRSMAVTVNPVRNAVVVDEWTEQMSAIDLRNAGRTALKNWSMENLRDAIILDGLMSINGVRYADATEAQKDAWLVDNTDRAQFGALRANSSSLDHSTSLATIDNTADKLSPALVSLAKRLAQTCSPAIQPIRLKEDEEWFVMFAPALPFRDLANDAVMTQANRDARERGVATNPLFTGGSLVWDGVIIREIPEIPVVSNGTINVAPSFLCGAQAVGLAWAERTKSTTDVDDYGFSHGVGIQEMRGVAKLTFGKGATDTADLVQNGIVTLWTAAVADA